MQLHLAKFLENNDSPSEGVLEEVKELFSKPLQELRNKDSEVERLIKVLDNIKEECNAIQESIDKYATILSPIRRLPSDILHEIFYNCLPTHRNPIMSITEAPLLLTRICQSWRSTALSSHRIWSKLHIPLLPNPTGNYSPRPYSPGVDMHAVLEEQRETAKKHARTMQARCKLTDIWLSRSGSCPLSISLNASAVTYGISEDNSEDENSLLQLFNSLISFSHRFSEIELSMPYAIYEILQNQISLEMVPMLRKLRINLSNRASPRAPGLPQRSIMLLQAPNLQSLSLCTQNFVAFDSRNIPPTWANLTNLAFNSAITSAEAVQVLRRGQNLEHCKLIISDGLDVYIDPHDVLSLPRIRYLSVHVGGTDSMTLFYRRIDAPLLNSFNYQKHHRFRFTDPDNGQVSRSPSPVLPLLERYNSIKKLSFDPRILSAQDLVFSFRFANQITHLIIGERPRNGQYSDNGYYLGPGSFSLDLLITGEDSSSDAAASEKEILLPKLEVFEAYLGTSFSDECLQRFILSRLNNPARKEVSALRKVKVNFDRQIDKDIEKEVLRRAKEVGVEIELDLRYFKPMQMNDTKYTDIFSPWYGLTESDRSWNYADIETVGS